MYYIRGPLYMKCDANPPHVGHYTHGPQAEGPYTELLECQGLGGNPLNKTFGTELYLLTVNCLFSQAS